MISFVDDALPRWGPQKKIGRFWCNIFGNNMCLAWNIREVVCNDQSLSYHHPSFCGYHCFKQTISLLSNFAHGRAGRTAPQPNACRGTSPRHQPLPPPSPLLRTRPPPQSLPQTWRMTSRTGYKRPLESRPQLTEK